MPTSWIATLMTPSHASEWVNGITGAGGAILGSFVTIAWTEWFNHRSRKRDRKAKNASIAFVFYQRLNHIYSVAVMIRDYLREGVAKARQMNTPLCAATMPMQRIAGPVNFPLEELWGLTQLGGTDLCNKLFGLDHSLNQLTDGIERYSTERDQVWSQLPAPSSMIGSLGSINLDQAQMQQATPAFVRLNSILEQVLTSAVELADRSFEAVTLLVQAPSQPLGEHFSVKLPDPRGKLIEISAKRPSRLSRIWHRVAGRP